MSFHDFIVQHLCVKFGDLVAAIFVIPCG